MSAHYYSLCNRYRGRAVQIRTHDERLHRGIIVDVKRNRVFIRPLGRLRNFGGFGYGYYGFGGSGFLYGLALGAIVSLVAIPFFFW